MPKGQKKDGTPTGNYSHGTKGGTVTVTARVPKELRDQLAARAQLAGVPLATWIAGQLAELARADHARQIADHLDAVGGMPSATP
jgi:predicted HicB family RNase H-like nuclease